MTSLSTTLSESSTTKKKKQNLALNTNSVLYLADMLLNAMCGYEHMLHVYLKSFIFA